MNFFNNYIFRTFIVVALLLVSIPLVMPRSGRVMEDYEDTSNLSYTARASKAIDIIEDFYGIKNSVAKAKLKFKLKTGLADLSDISADIYGFSNPQEEENIMASVPAHSAIAAASAAARQDDSSMTSEQRRSTEDLAPSNTAARGDYPIPVVYGKPNPNSNIEPKAASLDGKKYDVLEAHGIKYAITEKGPVELSAIIAKGGVYPSKTAALSESPVISREEYEARKDPTQAARLERMRNNSAAESFQGGGIRGDSSVYGSNITRASASDIYSLSAAAAAEREAKQKTERTLRTSYGGDNVVMIEYPKQPNSSTPVPENMAGSPAYKTYHEKMSTVTIQPDDPNKKPLIFKLPDATMGTNAKENVKIEKAKQT